MATYWLALPNSLPICSLIAALILGLISIDHLSVCRVVQRRTFPYASLSLSRPHPNLPARLNQPRNIHIAVMEPSGDFSRGSGADSPDNGGPSRNNPVSRRNYSTAGLRSNDGTSRLARDLRFGPQRPTGNQGSAVHGRYVRRTRSPGDADRPVGRATA